MTLEELLSHETSSIEDMEKYFKKAEKDRGASQRNSKNDWGG